MKSFLVKLETEKQKKAEKELLEDNTNKLIEVVCNEQFYTKQKT